MTKFYTASEEKLSIHLMSGIYPEMLAVNSRDDIRRWWEVIDRTTGEVVPVEQWSYDEGCSVNSIGCSPHPPNNNAANSTHAVVFIFLSLIYFVQEKKKSCIS